MNTALKRSAKAMLTLKSSLASNRTFHVATPVHEAMPEATSIVAKIENMIRPIVSGVLSEWTSKTAINMARPRTTYKITLDIVSSEIHGAIIATAMYDSPHIMFQATATLLRFISITLRKKLRGH
jgi:hypothetical protein